jgi:hypothetical protein
MLTNEQRKQKLLAFAKTSKHAALLTLIGVLIVLGSLGYSVYELKKLERTIREKQETSIKLDGEIQHKQWQVSEVERRLEFTQQALKTLEPDVPKEKLAKVIENNPAVRDAIDDAKTAPPPKQLNNDNPPAKDLVLATKLERDGFEALIQGNYDKAVVAFQASENAYNSFHNVYELARLLRRKKATMNDPIQRKEVFQTIVKTYSYGAPVDLWPQVVSISNQ